LAFIIEMAMKFLSGPKEVWFQKWLMIIIYIAVYRNTDHWQNENILILLIFWVCFEVKNFRISVANWKWRQNEIRRCLPLFHWKLFCIYFSVATILVTHYASRYASWILAVQTCFLLTKWVSFYARKGKEKWLIIV
jgi:hypothetical protein